MTIFPCPKGVTVADKDLTSPWGLLRKSSSSKSFVSRFVTFPTPIPADFFFASLYLCQLDLQISVTGLVNYEFTIGLCSPCTRENDARHICLFTKPVTTSCFSSVNEVERKRSISPPKSASYLLPLALRFSPFRFAKSQLGVSQEYEYRGTH